MTICPYLYFNGNCRDALMFYAEVFGTKPMIMDASGLPPEFDLPQEKKDQVMHGQIPVGDGVLMASDSIFEELPAMAGCAVQLTYPTAAEAKHKVDSLAAGGNVTMPWAATFWCAGFGTLTDKFGTRWMVGCEEAPSEI